MTIIRTHQRSAVNSPAVMSHYSVVDAKIDHPHTPIRELPELVRQSRLAPHERRRPLRERVSVRMSTI